jgi:ribosomal protein S18 acetylase RimI-like enzyme
LASALRLAFGHLPTDDQDARVANALGLVRAGELDAAGVMVARADDELLGAMICMPVAGASGLVWPPRVIPGAARGHIEDELVRFTTAWLRGRGAKLAQALLLPTESALAEPLERNGFVHTTSLWYMRHDLQLSADLLLAGDRLAYVSYAVGDAGLFARTLLRTYDQTLDCPEVNGVRAIGEILEGHRSQGCHDPDRWWLALDGERPVGVLLVTETPDLQGWDLSYLGVVPEARRQGIGLQLTCKALVEARAAEAAQLTLSVDARNRPAWDLYRRLGFEPFDQREVYLAIWAKKGVRTHY